MTLCKASLALITFLGLNSFAADKTVVFVEAESFKDRGGWVLDQQFMDQMGSPYLLAHGLGDPVKDAVTEVKFPAEGKYHLWVRTKDWVALWKAPGAPGKFQVLINGRAVPVTFGTKGAQWHWQDGGIVDLKASSTVALHDLTGFEGRCDALVFAKDPKFHPADDSESLAEFRRQALGLPKEPVSGGEYDLVVAGGGIAGTCAAMGASRLGLKVALIQDRPVLGGNNSSEVRVWLNGFVNFPPYEHVGDIVKELEPARRAHYGPSNTSDLYEDERRLALVRSEPNLHLFLNMRVNGIDTGKGKIRAVVAQDTVTGQRYRFAGKLFADCTGDASVGELAGADYEMTEKQHMGPSNLWNVQNTGQEQRFPACLCEDTNAVNMAFREGTNSVAFPRCPWALDLANKDFPGRRATRDGKSPLDKLGGWYWESGFDKDPINDMEWMRDLNFRAMYGAWDALKNVDKLYPNHKLQWAAYIAGKRESRRLMGDLILTAKDIQSGREFEDGCFPCTWSIDLHTPNSKYQKGHEGNEFISTYTSGEKYKYKTPYWAPYRCLYSRNIDNLFMAGRNISVSHDGLGAVRVMRTTGSMGEIVSMAAAICKEKNCTPRDVYKEHLFLLKAMMQKGVGKEVRS